MSWQRTNWHDPDIEAEDFLGGTRVRLTYPDGNVVIGKLTVAPNLRVGPSAGATMVRVTTPYSGDTWMDAGEADVEIWRSGAFDES